MAPCAGAPADAIGTRPDAALTYRSSGTCLVSPLGFNAKLEPVNAGVAWTITFTSLGTIDDHGVAAEVGQAVDTASFGVGPRMHMPAAHAYRDTFTVTFSEANGNGRARFHAGEASGTLTAGPDAGQSFSLSGFDLEKAAPDHVDGAYGSAAAPVLQTFTLANGGKLERLCVLTISTAPRS
jgi:hypothetical protein